MASPPPVSGRNADGEPSPPSGDSPSRVIETPLFESSIAGDSVTQPSDDGGNPAGGAAGYADGQPGQGDRA
ncbi:hypothetical protein KSP39_PZI017970 [Platanthera zijinensis]|uniref:Uncharacterized protein n=1 Tax=Platanthera zijinensis TaxID=2320716 RepID=A0AAP0FZC5_9ASPA